MIEFKQAADYYQSMEKEEKKALAENIAESLMFEDEKIIETILGYFGQVDETLEKNLRQKLYF